MSIEEAKNAFLKNYFNSYGSLLVKDHNIYGPLYEDGRYYRANYACHSKLSGDDYPNPDAIIISAIYSNQTGWSFEEQNKYFEYILDPETSPWHQVIEKLDLEVIRNDAGLVQWIVIKTMDINRYFLFSFLKGFRQVWERGTALKLFTDALSDDTLTKEQVYEIFLMAQLFKGNADKMTINWGGDHMVFKGPPSEALKKRDIVDFDEQWNQELYSEDNDYFEGVDLQEMVWGVKLLEYEWETHRGELPKVLRNDGALYGYFLNKPTTDSSRIISFEKVKENLHRLRDYFSKFGVSFA